jgi:hypothetical protein
MRDFLRRSMADAFERRSLECQRRACVVNLPLEGGMLSLGTTERKRREPRSPAKEGADVSP